MAFNLGAIISVIETALAGIGIYSLVQSIFGAHNESQNTTSAPVYYDPTMGLITTMMQMQFMQQIMTMFNMQNQGGSNIGQWLEILLPIGLVILIVGLLKKKGLF